MDKTVPRVGHTCSRGARHDPPPQHSHHSLTGCAVCAGTQVSEKCQRVAWDPCLDGWTNPCFARASKLINCKMTRRNNHKYSEIFCGVRYAIMVSYFIRNSAKQLHNGPKPAQLLVHSVYSTLTD